MSHCLVLLLILKLFSCPIYYYPHGLGLLLCPMSLVYYYSPWAWFTIMPHRLGLLLCPMGLVYYYAPWAWFTIIPYGLGLLLCPMGFVYYYALWAWFTIMPYGLDSNVTKGLATLSAKPSVFYYFTNCTV